MQAARSIRRGLIQAHAWVGLAASLLLIAIGASGSLLVLKDSWIRWTVSAAREAAALDTAALARTAEAAESLFGRDLVAVKFARPDLGVHRVYLADGGGAYLDGDGRLIERWPENGRLEDWLLDLHFKLLGGEAGESIVGWLGLVCVLLALSGLYLWWPARRGYRHRFWPRGAARRELLATHRNTGVWAVLPIAFLALSGTGMIFHEQSTALMERLLGPAERTGSAAPPAAVTTGAADVNWQALLAAGQDRFPDGTARIVNWPAQGRPAVVRYRQPAELHPNGRSTVAWDPGSNAIVHSADATGFGLALKIQHALYPLHSARIGGRLYAAAVALSGVMLTALGLFGAWSFLVRPRRRGVTARPSASSSSIDSRELDPSERAGGSVGRRQPQ